MVTYFAIFHHIKTTYFGSKNHIEIRALIISVINLTLKVYRFYIVFIIIVELRTTLIWYIRVFHLILYVYKLYLLDQKLILGKYEYVFPRYFVFIPPIQFCPFYVIS